MFASFIEVVRPEAQDARASTFRGEGVSSMAVLSLTCQWQNR